jgi:GT2 family glycosyltransferase
MERFGVVIPVGAGRAENLALVLNSLNVQTVKPEVVVLVCDGPGAYLELEPKEGFDLPISVIHAPKHEPGMEQPRNIGVRELEKFGCTHAWFLDTDVIIGEDALEQIFGAYVASENQGERAEIVVAPYDWMPPGARAPMPSLQNDPRWPSFDRYAFYEVIRGDLAAGLACFSGNLVWPIEEFKRVGGFWSELHHGRCEDGELGLRAVRMGIGITFQRTARGWHLWHPINEKLTEERNARDVPMLNDRHPWVQGEGVFVVEEDGARFDVNCPNCNQTFKTVEIFAHQAGCP